MELLSLAFYAIAFGTALYAIRKERENDRECAVSFDSVWDAIERAEDRIGALEPKPKKKKGA